MSESSERAELQRTLGLTQAMAIGMGTMVGAGIFVFPGLAGGEAGPAALLSFLLGGVVATLVALPTAELAAATSLSPAVWARWPAPSPGWRWCGGRSGRAISS